MNELETEKVIRATKELADIRAEYLKTQRLLEAQCWEELQQHITAIIRKYPEEALVHNCLNPCMPDTIQQNAINCMRFLQNLFAAKLGVGVAEAIQHLMK